MLRAFCILLSLLLFPNHSSFAANPEPYPATRGVSIIATEPDTGEKQEIRLYSKSYAVIVGIDQYKNLPFDRQLSYAVRDASGVEETLKKHFRFDRITTILNKDATKENILKVLSGDLSALSPEDSVFVFWAGHGYTEKTPYGDLGYLIPFDGSFEEAEMHKNISMTTLKDISKRIPAKHVFFVMDACYSGLLAEKRGAERKTGRNLAYLEEITKENVRQVLTAGNKEQQVLDGGPMGHSVFTGRFIEALENTEDFVTASEISILVKEKVFSDAQARDHVQTPTYGELFGVGDYVFVPSLDRKVEDVREQLAYLEKEKKRLEDLEKSAAAAQDERVRRRAEIEKHAVEAKLTAERLRQERLAEEKRQREKDLQARIAYQEEALRKKQEADSRLNALKDVVEAKRKQLGSLSAPSLLPGSTLREIRDIDSQVKAIRANYRRELAGIILSISQQVNGAYQKAVSSQQSEFESKDEFEARIETLYTATNQEQTRLFEEAIAKTQKVYAEELSFFTDALKQLSSKEFTILAQDLELSVGKYDPEKDVFPVSIKLKQPVEDISVSCSARLPVPRDKAQTFKQHFQNGILRPELAGYFQSAGFFRITEARVIDDATSESFDLFSSDFVDFGNGIVYDPSLKILWAQDAQCLEFKSSKNWFASETFEKELSLSLSKFAIAGLRGWRCPDIGEIKRMSAASGVSDLFKNTENVRMSTAGCSDSGFLARRSSYYSGGTIDGFVVYALQSKSSNRLCGHNSSGPTLWPVRGDDSPDGGGGMDKRSLDAYALLGEEFLDLGNGTVLDTRTKLLWAKNAQSSKYKGSANGFGDDFEKDIKTLESGIDISGLRGWRLPENSELVRMTELKKRAHPFSNLKGVRVSSSGCSDSGFLVRKNGYQSGGTIDGYYVYSIDSGSSNRLCGFGMPDLVVWPVRGGRAETGN